MAREGQGLQILVIIFVFLTMILAFGTWYGISNWATTAELIEAKEGELKKEKELRQTTRKQAEVFMYMAGLGPLDEETYKSYMAELTTSANVDPNIQTQVKDVQKAFNEDMNAAKLGQNPEESLNWRTQAKSYRTIISQNLSNIEAKEIEVEGIRAQQVADKKAYDADIVKHKAEVTKYIADKNRIEVAAKAKEDELMAANLATEKKLDETEKKNIADIKVRDAQIAAIKPMIKERDKLITDLRQVIRSMQPDDFDVADGKITLTNVSTKTAWVNLGSKDNLRPQISFAVYGQGVTKFIPENKKGEIQIQQIVGPHLSTARIVSDDLRNPILAEDYIHTPAWSPSLRIKFVVAGFFDLDGDAINDQNRFKTILEANNGEIIAELSANGEVVGDLSEVGPTARYFVQGDIPQDANMQAKYATYSREAEVQKIETINYRDLLEKMGVRGEARTAKPGKDGGSKFKPRRGPKGGAY